MRILSLHSEPILEIECLNAGACPGAFTVERIPVLAGVAAGMPLGIDALIVTSDLQARETFQQSEGRAPRLLGEVLPGLLADEWLPGWGFPAAKRTGVLLAGDFWTEPALDARGGIGDVTSVWRGFGSRFAWVAGVAGNHDAFGPELGRPPRFTGNLHFLDGHCAEPGGLRIAGVSGIIGNPRKPWRRLDSDYLTLLECVLDRDVDVLVLHDGPDSPPHRFKGSPRVREVIDRRRPPLVIRGHDHWTEPLVELAAGVQVLNVDFRVVLLTRAADE